MSKRKPMDSWAVVVDGADLHIRADMRGADTGSADVRLMWAETLCSPCRVRLVEKWSNGRWYVVGRSDGHETLRDAVNTWVAAELGEVSK